MRTLPGTLVAILLLGLVFASQAWGQDGAASRHKGFWLNFGVGYGSADWNCDGCDTDRQDGVAVQLGLGGTVSQQLLLGFESNGWSKKESGGKTTLSTGAVVAYYYPMTGGNLFLKGGIGLSYWQFDYQGGGSDDDTGLGLLAGVGCDIPLGTRFSITPVAAFQYGVTGAYEGTSGISQHVFSIGAAVTLH